jgi:P-aminobenzoate N-oxygenase AurF
MNSALASDTRLADDSHAVHDQRLANVATRLSERSAEAAANPRMPLPWPASIPAEAWCMSPELISIAGTPAWDALDEHARRRLSFFECANFFALNIHGERALMEGIARRLYARDLAPHAHYLHHFLAEENQHMTWFGGFCQRYAGKIYPDRKLVLPREHAPGEEDLLFFARVLVFELIVDGYNQRMAKDGRLHPLVCEINRRHHEDESRHLAFGRLVVEDLWARHAPRWSEATRAGVRHYMAAYVDATWREYYNPDVYRDAGLAEPYQLAREAFAAPVSRARRDDVGRRCVRILTEIGLWPISEEYRS